MTADQVDDPPEWIAVNRHRSVVYAVLAGVVSLGCGPNTDESPPVVAAPAPSTATTLGPTAPRPTSPPTRPTAISGVRQPVPADTFVEPEAPRPATVAVVGDSLTVSAREEIEAALVASGFTVLAIDGLESRRMSDGGSSLPPGVNAVADILESERPELWVIALGTNDVASGGNLDGFRGDMDAILDRIPQDTPVIWVDLWIRDRAESIAEANRLIRAQLRTWSGGAAVVDWFAHGDADGIIVGDGVHLTAAGQQLFADSIVSAVDDLFGDDPSASLFRSTSVPTPTSAR